VLIVPEGFDAHPPHLPQTPVARAAGLARAAMVFRKQLKQGLVEPDASKEGPICMDTFRYSTLQSIHIFLIRI
jgi:carnitine O-acetyltransferase